MQKGRDAEEQIGKVSERQKSRGGDRQNKRETKDQIGKRGEMQRGREVFLFLASSFRYFLAAL